MESFTTGILWIFVLLKKYAKLIYFSLIATPFFQKSLRCNFKFFFLPNIATIFWRKKNNIKAETNKTPIAATDLTWKSRFRYIKIWIYSISLRKHMPNFLKFKNIWCLFQRKFLLNPSENSNILITKRTFKIR